MAGTLGEPPTRSRHFISPFIYCFFQRMESFTTPFAKFFSKNAPSETMAFARSLHGAVAIQGNGALLTSLEDGGRCVTRQCVDGLAPGDTERLLRHRADTWQRAQPTFDIGAVFNIDTINAFEDSGSAKPSWCAYVMMELRQKIAELEDSMSTTKLQAPP